MKLIDKKDRRIPNGVVVTDLPPPPTGNKLYYDDEVKGFAVRVTAAGSRSFVLNYRAAGRERRYTIGSFPDWSVASARREAGEMKRRVDRGEDPMAERHSMRAAPTVAELVEHFKADHLPRKSPATARDYAAMLDKIVKPRLGTMKAADVIHADIHILHRELSRRAPTRANRLVATVSKMFSYAVKMGWRSDNPCKGLERNPEERRERFLSPAELGFLSETLNELQDQCSADAIRLLMLTGARRMEVLSGTWDQFDLAAGIWTKPSAHTKQRKTHRVPLSAPALQLLTRMRADADKAAAQGTHGATPYLFPGDAGRPHQTDLKRSWATLTARATVRMWAADPDRPAGALVSELTAQLGATPPLAAIQDAAARSRVDLPAGMLDVRLHDLRHSFASLLASAGMSLPIIGALLGHTQPATTARYSHLMDHPLREAAERVGRIVEGAKNGGTVLRLR